MPADDLDKLRPKLPERERARLLGKGTPDIKSRPADAEAILRKYARPAACVLLVDVSVSMSSDDKLGQARTGAGQFATTATAARYQVALASFSSTTRALANLTTDAQLIASAARELSIEGSTDMASGLRFAAQLLTEGYEPRAIVVFTDGMPDSEDEAVEVANAIKAQGIQIIARGTAPANLKFLRRIASGDSLAEVVTSREISAGIQSAARLLPRPPK